MNIIDIYKTKKEDIRLKNYEGRDVYTYVYIDENKQKKEIQCFADTENFMNALNEYEKHLKKVELRINKDIINYFAQVKKKRNKIAMPFYIIGGAAILLACTKPPEIIGIPLFFGGWGFVFGPLMIANADIEMTEDNIKKYVPDQNVIKAKEEIDKKLQFVKSLKNKYQPQVLSKLQKEKEEIEKSNKIMQELEKQKEQNIMKEEDYLDYVKLSEEDKLKLKKKAKSIRNIQIYSKFLPDVPSFIARSFDREDTKIRNFLEFALTDRTLIGKETNVNIREVDIKNIIEATDMNSGKENIETDSNDLAGSKGGKR